MEFPGFCGDSGTSQSLIAESRRTVNLILQRFGAEGAAALYPTPGYRPWSNGATDVNTRALVTAGDLLFSVTGGQLYEYAATGVATKRGALMAADGNRAQIVYNGQVGGQLGICTGRNFYAYDMATHVLTPVLAGEADVIAYAAGRGFALNLLTGRIRLSNLNNFLVWDPGTFIQRSLAPDPYRAMFTDGNNLLWCVGTESFEVRYDSGTGTQPWQPLTGLQGGYGIVSPYAWGKVGNGHVWVAQTSEGIGPVVMTQQSVPQPVSSDAVDTAIASYLRTSRVDDAEVLPYSQDGHVFANVSFPSAPATWTYDQSMKSWAERGVWNSNRGDYDLWAPRVAARAWNKLLIGDRMTGALYHMDASYATELDGVTGIRRLRRAPHISRDHKRIPITQFEILMDVGLGLAAGQGSDPQIMLRLSADGGRTFGNELQAGTGKLGQWATRVYWSNLGAPQDPVFEIAYSEPTPLRIVNALLNNAG